MASPAESTSPTSPTRTSLSFPTPGDCGAKEREVRKLEDSRHELRMMLALEPRNGTPKNFFDAVLHEMIQD
jgi:hypothetical protein